MAVEIILRRCRHQPSPARLRVSLADAGHCQSTFLIDTPGFVLALLLFAVAPLDWETCRQVGNVGHFAWKPKVSMYQSSLFISLCNVVLREGVSLYANTIRPRL